MTVHVITSPTRRARKAMLPVPGTSDPLTNLPLLHARVDLDYVTNDFVARDSRISGSPETFYQKFIAVNSVKFVNSKIE